MKTLVKKHMIGLFTLVLTVATMSFKMIEKSNVSEYWFEVGIDGNQIGDPTSAPGASGDCNTLNTTSICKVKLSVPTPPATVSDAHTGGVYLGAGFRNP